MHKQRGFYFADPGLGLAILAVLGFAVARYAAEGLGLSAWLAAAAGAGTVLVACAAVSLCAVWRSRRRTAPEAPARHQPPPNA